MMSGFGRHEVCRDDSAVRLPSCTCPRPPQRAPLDTRLAPVYLSSSKRLSGMEELPGLGGWRPCQLAPCVAGMGSR